MEMWSTEAAQRIRRESLAKARELGIEVRPVPRAPKPALREPKAVRADAFVWWVARCAPGRAFRVADDLEARGFSTFAPASRKILASSRPIRGRPAKKMVQRPVFGSYAFVGAPEGRGVWKRNHEKIEEILGDGTRPIPVPSRAVQLLSDLDCAGEWGGLMTLDGEGAPFRRGDSVRFAVGPFAELMGIVKEMRGTARAVIESTLFGGPMEFTVEACQLEKASL